MRTSYRRLALSACAYPVSPSVAHPHTGFGSPDTRWSQHSGAAGDVTPPVSSVDRSFAPPVLAELSSPSLIGDEPLAPRISSSTSAKSRVESSGASVEEDERSLSGDSRKGLGSVSIGCS